jgi:hypothetical protein
VHEAASTWVWPIEGSCLFVKLVERVLQFRDRFAKWTANIAEVIAALVNLSVGFTDELGHTIDLLG